VRRTLVALATLALIAPASAAADIGIVRVAPTSARPGERVRVTAGGYLGMTHQRFLLVLMAAAQAPLPHSCRHGSAVCTPSFLPAALERAPFHLVGSITRWREIAPRGAQQGRATVRVRIPRVSSGRYVFALFCPSCTPGPKGSLIVAEKLILRVRN
jgi:hypothetical protein